MSDGRQLSREVQEKYRFRALRLRKKGWKVKDIAESMEVHVDSVSRWLTQHRREGRDRLRLRKAPGKSQKLSVEQKLTLLRYLKKPAIDYGFETSLWTRDRVRQLVDKSFHITLHKTNVGVWLRQWGWSPQTPERRAIEQNKKAAKKWLTDTWPKIQAHAKRWHAITYFQDEAGVALTAALGKTWAPVGKTPIVNTTGHRGNITVTSVISPAGHMLFRLEKEKVRITAQIHIEFLEQVLQHHTNRKIIIIEDNAPPHIAKAVENFVQQNKNRLTIYWLPAYSPELNPDEKTWRQLKQHELKAHNATTTAELRILIRNKMRSIQHRKQMIKHFFQDKYPT
jgi:transposase